MKIRAGFLTKTLPLYLQRSGRALDLEKKIQS